MNLRHFLCVAILTATTSVGCSQEQTEGQVNEQGMQPTDHIMDLKDKQVAMPRLPMFDRTFWLNANPEIVNELKGKVVVVDFWEYTCVNCIRTFPYVKEWHRRYSDDGLIILGVHTPEFEFGKERKNVAQATKDFDLRYPIVMDNDYTVWHIFGNRYWPAKYIFDRNGILRYYHFGEGSYGETEQVIQKLLREISPDAKFPSLMEPIRETDQPGAVCYRVTPETYLGFERGLIGNEEGYSENTVVGYRDPGEYREDRFYLVGRWSIGRESVRLASKNGEPGSIIMNYTAAEVNLVIHPEAERGFKVYVEQDGRSVTNASKGDDVRAEPDGKTYLLIDQLRMYNIVKNKKFDRYTVTFTSASNSFGAYAFTFVSMCVTPGDQ